MRGFRFLSLILMLLTSDFVYASVSLLGPLAREHTVALGEKFEGVILLRNSGSEATTVRIYQTDYAYFADGTNDFGAPGRVARSNASWITVSSTLLKVPAGQTLDFSYSGRVPKNATLPGSYWSIIMIENVAPLEDSVRGEGVQTLARYGVQVVTQIGETGKRSVRFAKNEFLRQDAKAYALLDLENDGDCLIFPKLWIELYDSAGNKLGRFDTGSMRIYPGCSARYRVELPGVPAGAYNALVFVDCGHDQMVGTRVALKL